MRSLSSKGLVLIATLAALSACSAGNERASATADSSGVPDAPQTSTADSIAMPSVQHAVSINRVSLSDDEVVESERTHRIRIPDADYWYDPVLGAWGVIGSPTLGFLAAGLRLGGPMPADVSGKGTNIFVNGNRGNVFINTQIEIKVLARTDGINTGFSDKFIS